MSEPLTDEDLAEIQHKAEQQATFGEPMFKGPEILRLVAEVRRLRSDEWLRAAAEEIADKYESGTASRLASAVLILRKHRDGKA